MSIIFRVVDGPLIIPVSCWWDRARDGVAVQRAVGYLSR